MSNDPAGAGERPDQAAQDVVSAGQGDRRVACGEHAAHDQLLVARFVAGDVSEAEADAARELVSSCPDCRLLASDLAQISRATADLPAPIRTRDFRISPEEAERLRRSRMRRWLSRLAGGLDGRFGPLVPLQRLAAAAVAIGLVMAVVTSPVGVPGLTPGAATLPSAGRAMSGGEGSASTPGAAPTAAPAALPAAPAASAAGPAAMAAASAPAAPVGPLAAAAPAATAGPLAAPVPVASRPPAVERPLVGAAPTSPAASMAPSPEQSAEPGVAFSQGPPPAGSARPGPAGRPPLEAWQAWLLVATAGLAAFGLLRWRTRAQ